MKRTIGRIRRGRGKYRPLYREVTTTFYDGTVVTGWQYYSFFDECWRYSYMTLSEQREQIARCSMYFGSVPR